MSSEAQARTLVIPGGEDAAWDTRKAIDAEFGAELSPRLLYLVQLLASELVADSMRYGRVPAGASVQVAVDLGDQHIRVEVTDPGPAQDIEAPAEDFPGGSPWSVFLIDQLADRWGADGGESMRVWVEIDRSRWEPAAPPED